MPALCCYWDLQHSGRGGVLQVSFSCPVVLVFLTHKRSSNNENLLWRTKRLSGLCYCIPHSGQLGPTTLFPPSPPPDAVAVLCPIHNLPGQAPPVPRRAGLAGRDATNTRSRAAAYAATNSTAPAAAGTLAVPAPLSSKVAASELPVAATAAAVPSRESATAAAAATSALPVAASAPAAQPPASSRRRARGPSATVFPTRTAIGTPAEEAEGRSLHQNPLVTHNLL